MQQAGLKEGLPILGSNTLIWKSLQRHNDSVFYKVV